MRYLCVLAEASFGDAAQCKRKKREDRQYAANIKAVRGRTARRNDPVLASVYVSNKPIPRTGRDRRQQQAEADGRRPPLIAQKVARQDQGAGSLTNTTVVGGGSIAITIAISGGGLSDIHNRRTRIHRTRLSCIASR